MFLYNCRLEKIYMNIEKLNRGFTGTYSEEYKTRWSLNYIKFFSNYKEIYKYNQRSLKYFHKNHYHNFQYFLKNPLEVSKVEAQKKIESIFKVYTLHQYLALIMSDLSEEKRDFYAKEAFQKRDFSLIFKIIKKIILNLIDNIKDYQSKENFELLQIYSPYSKKNKGMDLEDNFDLDNENIMVIDYMEFSDLTVFILPKDTKFNGDKEKNYGNFEKNMKEAFMKVQDEKLLLDFFLSNIPPEIVDFYNSFFNKIYPAEEFNNKQIPHLFQWVFEEKEVVVNKRKWNINRNFHIEYCLISQLFSLFERINSLSNEFFQTFPDLKSTNEIQYKHMCSRKEKVANNLRPNPNKEAFKEVFHQINLNYMEAFSWIFSKEFLRLLFFNEGRSPEEETILDCWLEPTEEPPSPLSLLYLYLMKIQAQIDPIELYSKFPLLKSLEDSALMDFINKKPNSDDIDIRVNRLNDFISEILKKNKDASFTNEQLLSNTPNNRNGQFQILLNGMALKYESSLVKDSFMDIKQFLFSIELEKNRSCLILRMKTTDFSMTIENGDELLYFIQTIVTKFEELTLDIDEGRKNLLKVVLYNIHENFSIQKILETLDFLYILVTNFYILCIRSIYYFKPTKDVEKYELFITYMKENIEIHKRELEILPKWQALKKNI